MIIEEIGNIFFSNAEALVNPVNCVGVMGKGLALQFKNKYPSNFISYKEACANKELYIGTIHIFSTGLNTPKYIINFPTKNHWKDISELSYINIGLESLIKEVITRNIKTIAIPKLGCGLGGLKWETVKPLISSYFRDLYNITCYLY